MSSPRPRLAVVLSGGGARGAYEVGVLDFILRTLSRKLGRELRFDILTGTSVGALNASWLAATCDDPRASMKALKAIWLKQQVAEIFDMDYGDLWGVARTLLSGAARLPRLGPDRRVGGLLNSAPIERITRQDIPWDRIAQNQRRGLLDALSVTCTEVDSGRTVLFMQRADGTTPRWGGDPRKVALPADIQADHALASAAIPLLFPSVLINNHYYCDGALRENTPVAPALRLGADKVLIIALREKDADHPLAVPLQEPAYPGFPELLGKLLSGLLLDPLEFELEQLRRFNSLADHARARPEKENEPLYAEVDDLLTHVRGAGLRHAHCLLVRPSTNIAALTGQLLLKAPDEIWGRGPVSNLARRLARDSAGKEADLLSFLFFDGFYTRELIELGFRDAMERRDELEAFFCDP